MPYKIEFDKCERYKSVEIGITIPTTLRFGERETYCTAKIDTGAQVCLFEREIGEYLGLEIENGTPLTLETLAGNLPAFGHEITIETFGIVFHPTVYFPQSYELQRNILGRQGWFQLVKLGLIDYDNEIYLSPYNKE